jgi:hypothetical protein
MGRFLPSLDGLLLMLKFPIRESDGNTSRMVLEKLTKRGENQRVGKCRRRTDSRTLSRSHDGDVVNRGHQRDFVKAGSATAN